MSGDPLSTLGPSDSGFLNSFSTPSPSTPLSSNIGEEEQASEETAQGDQLRLDPAEDPLLGKDSVLGPDVSEEETAEAATDSQIDSILHATPLPDGLMESLHRSFIEGRFDESDVDPASGDDASE